MPSTTPISFGGSGPDSAKVKKTATMTPAAAKMTRPECATPPTIASRALPLLASQCSFALSGPLPPKEMGVVLGIAVLLDALLIRLLLIPVLLRLTGRVAWASPAWLRRILPNVRFAHGTAQPGAPLQDITR